LLAPAWDAAGGASRAVHIDVAEPPRSETFRAPDTLCPAAARLAAGTRLDELGTTIDTSSLATLALAEPEVERGMIRCEVIDFNRFGNVRLNVRREQFAASGLDSSERVKVEAVSGSTKAKRGTTYADFAAGEYGVLFDPRGWLTIVRGNPASALDGLGLAIAAPIWLTRPAAAG
jgi:hypothetical protein